MIGIYHTIRPRHPIYVGGANDFSGEVNYISEGLKFFK